MPLDRNFTPLEPFDLATPRLTYEEVRVLVGDLGDLALSHLASGPIELDGECRVCEACDVAEGHAEPPDQDEVAAAKMLRAWHDNLGWSGFLVDNAIEPAFQGALNRGAVEQPLIDQVIEERHVALGRLAHARCCVIYALATVEMIERISRIARPTPKEE